MKIKILILLFLGMLNVNAQVAKKTSSKKAATSSKKATATKSSDEGMFAIFETSKGKIKVELEYKKAPVTVANFVSLAEGTNTFLSDAKFKGKPFYNGLKFHRVIKDFMIQGGDPAGNGSGGPGYAFKDEIVSEFKFDKGGILAMANSGLATNGSQFFITHKETGWLTGKHTIFGYVVSGMDVVNAIAQDDVINKITIERKGADAKNFNAPKIFSDYFATKGEDDKKANLQMEEAKKQQAAKDLAAKKIYDETYAPIKAAKVKELNAIRATATKSTTGLESKITKTGTGVKPAEGTNVFIYYAGYLEDGTLFDSNYEEVNKQFGKFDANRSAQNGYQPFPFQAGKKDGLIPGFIEGINNLSFGDKIVLFIPSALGYGERGAGGVIPPNSNIIFEVEMLQTMPAPPVVPAQITPAPKK